MKWKHFLGLSALTVIGLALAIAASRSKTAPPQATGTAEPGHTLPSEPAASQEPAVIAPHVEDPPAPRGRAPRPPERLALPPSVPPTEERDESSLMGDLRALGGSDPALSLTLAREGNARFNDSADAVERSWIIVKALMNMGRQDEALAEARTLVEKYPGTSWADDVHRHLFLNPRSDPSERGYGRATELE